MFYQNWLHQLSSLASVYFSSLSAHSHTILAMVIISQSVSKRSLDFKNQKKAYLLRHVDGLSWRKVAKRVKNIGGKTPSWGMVRDVVTDFSVAKGHREFQYARCGRKPWKLTGDVKKFLLRRLRSDRTKKIVTSVTLQADLAAEKGVEAEDSTIRKFLKDSGYRWKPRSQKMKYSKEQMGMRLAFARMVLRMTKAELRAKVCMSLDGVVLSMPPTNATERFNYAWGGATHMWRKDGEANLPQLAGRDDYSKQVPLHRAIPLWGGLSEDGFAPVLFHPKKKTNQDEWSQAVREGKVTEALRRLNPRKKSGPWSILCDGESFLRAKKSMAAYRLKKIVLWDVPVKSPDLNPIELFWGWIRKRLRHMDLDDLRKKKPLLGKAAYVVRVKGIMRTRKAQLVAKAFASRLRKTCQQVVDRKGAAADN